jgi:hypothetical protein
MKGCIRCNGTGVVGRVRRRVFYCTCLRGVLMFRRILPTPRKQIARRTPGRRALGEALT